MATYDVFNGDADGLCALQQLRLAAPRASVLITGAKRDIELLRRVPWQAGDRATVLDISLDRNRAALAAALDAGASVEWFDHHHAGALPQHPRLAAHIDQSEGTCTSLIVDRHLGGAQRAWAVVGAFGDHLASAAEHAAAPLGLDAAALDVLRELGESLNYNAYGASAAELCIAPEVLAGRMLACADPLAFAAREPVVAELHARRRADLEQALQLAPACSDDRVAAYRLPDTAWARRIGGTFAHHLARLHPRRAHAVLGANADGTLWASLRAPLAAPRGAAAVARRFATGGGREGAAGIERLPAAAVVALVAAMQQQFADR